MPGSQNDEDTHYLVDHKVGGVLNGDIPSLCAIEPQQRSKNSHKASSPTWNQGFVFADVRLPAQYFPPRHIITLRCGAL
jgi:hypothetical protein